MAFCTGCGATVQGAFCQQCGTPQSATAAQPAAPQAMPPAAPQAAYAGAAPVKGKISPIVWILLAVVGNIVLGIVGLFVLSLLWARSPSPLRHPESRHTTGSASSRRITGPQDCGTCRGISGVPAPRYF